MDRDGWISLHRKLLEKPIWLNSTPEQRSVLIAVLLMVNHEPKQWEWKGQQFTARPGQTITSLESIRKAAGKGISIQNVRSSLKRFKKLDFLTYEATKTGRLISIINWDSYQGVQHRTQHRAQQRPNKGPTTNNNDNNEINKKPSSKSSFEGDGFEVYKTKKKRDLTGKRLISFLRFWDTFGYKSGKAEAADAWFDIPELTDSLVDRICNAARIENQNRAELKSQGRAPKMAEGWISGQRWEDEVYQTVGEARAQAEGKAQTRRVAEDAALAQNQAEQAERSKAARAKQKAVEALTPDQLAGLDGFIGKQDLKKMLRQRFQKGQRTMLRIQFVDSFLEGGSGHHRNRDRPEPQPGNQAAR
ncbi:MAG: hypothetical protein GY737_14520 [Desulfobacteraceae bacterium]|nr:hypothetical protein [Desulfobacteraceae bacterium]